MNILPVEENLRIVNFIAEGWRENSFAIDPATDDEAALYRASVNEYGLIIPDVMIPTIFERFFRKNSSIFAITFPNKPQKNKNA